MKQQHPVVELSQQLERIASTLDDDFSKDALKKASVLILAQKQLITDLRSLLNSQI